MLDLFFRKWRLRRELVALRQAIEAKRADVADAESTCRKAWGKKWSYIQMQRRRRVNGGTRDWQPEEMDGQAEVFEMRRQHHVMELKAREQELDELLAKEKLLAVELGEAPTDRSEGDREER